MFIHLLTGLDSVLYKGFKKIPGENCSLYTLIHIKKAMVDSRTK